MITNTRKIQEILNKFNLSINIKEFPNSTKTSSDAAKVIGCNISQIAKSIIFRGVKTNNPYLVIASGSKRINEKKIEEIVKEKIEKANAEFVKKETGFGIGGVAPFGHIKKIQTFIDKDLFKYKEIWAAAGTSNSVFKINPKKLLKITEGKIVDIS